MLRRVIFVFTSSLCILAAPALTPAGIGTDARLEQAQRYFRTAELAERNAPLRNAAYSKAVSLAEEVIVSNPTSADAHFLLFAARGRRLLDESGKPSVMNFWKYADVNKHLTRALELDPGHAKALAAKGGILLDLPSALGGDPNVARQLLERAVEINPTGLGSRVTLARALLKNGERDTARRHLLLAAHYACLKREAAPLMQAESMLARLTAGTL